MLTFCVMPELKLKRRSYKEISRLFQIVGKTNGMKLFYDFLFLFNLNAYYYFPSILLHFV